MLWLSHTPCRSGWPHGVRSTFLVWPEANGAVVTNTNMAKKTAFLIRIGCPGFRSRERITGKLIPLLLKEGWPRHQKMVPFRKGADGVVARESRFATRFDTFARERPPRLRRFGSFATFY